MFLFNSVYTKTL